jgi:hypothetical protein
MNRIFTRPNILRGIFALIMAGCLVIIGLAGATMVGCATATVDVPACDMQSTNFGTVPSTHAASSTVVTLPPAPVSFDLSDAIKKIGDVADSEQINVTSFTIDNSTGDLSWVRSVNVSLQDGTLLASGQWGGDPGSSLSLALNPQLSGDQILGYLKAGPVNLNIVVAGDVAAAAAVPPGTQLQNNVNLCVDAQGTVSKSL